jgi:hypothetical protein
MRKESAALTITAMAVFALTMPAPLLGQTEQKSVLEGRCQYPDRVARHRDETLLILCDTASISGAATSSTLDFGQRSWGSMAQFTGVMAGNKMAVSRITLRGGRSFAATGTCEIFYRNDGRLSAISCWGRAGSRSIAANFVPSRR